MKVLLGTAIARAASICLQPCTYIVCRPPWIITGVRGAKAGVSPPRQSLPAMHYIFAVNQPGDPHGYL